MSLCVCMLVCVHVCILVYIYLYIRIRLHMFAYVYTYIHTYIYIHICVGMYVRTCMHACRHACICRYICIYTQVCSCLGMSTCFFFLLSRVCCALCNFPAAFCRPPVDLSWVPLPVRMQVQPCPSGRGPLGRELLPTPRTLRPERSGNSGSSFQENLREFTQILTRNSNYTPKGH